MGNIYRKYTVTEEGYFEDTDKNLEAIENGEIADVEIDDYCTLGDWELLPGIIVEDDNGNILFESEDY